MKKCSNCGFENKETSNYCENCGTKLEENIGVVNDIKEQNVEESVNQNINVKTEELVTKEVVNNNSENVINNDNVIQNNTVNNNQAQQTSANQIVKEDKNVIGLIGFILSLISLILCCGSFSLISLILSIVGVVESKKVNGKNKGLSIAGIVLSSIGLLLLIILYSIGLLADIANSVN